jgi:hypothetical protein
MKSDHRCVTELFDQQGVDGFRDAIRFYGRLLERGGREREADDQQVRLAVARCVALLAASFLMTPGAGISLGGPTMVLVMAGILDYLDVFPHRALKLLQSQ